VDVSVWSVEGRAMVGRASFWCLEYGFVVGIRDVTLSNFCSPSTARKRSIIIWLVLFIMLRHDVCFSSSSSSSSSSSCVVVVVAKSGHSSDGLGVKL
jgi:hypothetical protein